MRQNTKRVPVKGTSRRIVIVPGEEGGVFEQIIYVVRDEAFLQKGVTAEHVLQEAMLSLKQQDAADESEDMKPESFLFSKIVFILMMIVFVLTAAILAYLHFHGLS